MNCCRYFTLFKTFYLSFKSAVCATSCRNSSICTNIKSQTPPTPTKNVDIALSERWWLLVLWKVNEIYREKSGLGVYPSLGILLTFAPRNSESASLSHCCVSGWGLARVVVRRMRASRLWRLR